jgi:zinc protease
MMRRKTLIRHAACISALLLLGATLPGTAAPQLTQSTNETPASKVERKNKAPLSRDVLRVKLPRPVEAKLENGLTVLILEDHRTPAVFVQLHIGGAGALFEPPGMTGLASATAQMLREGTRSRTSIQIA